MRMNVRRARFRFSLRHLLALVAVSAIVLSAAPFLFKWQRQNLAEKAVLNARENDVKFVRTDTLYVNGSLVADGCLPRVLLSGKRSVIRSQLPYIAALYPSGESGKVGVFLSGQNYADSGFLVELKASCPNCIFYPLGKYNYLPGNARWGGAVESDLDIVPSKIITDFGPNKYGKEKRVLNPKPTGAKRTNEDND